MPTIDELRAHFGHMKMISDDMLMSPHFHLGALQGYQDDLPERMKLSLAVIQDALAADLVMDAECDCGVRP